MKIHLGQDILLKQYKKRLDLILNGWFYSQVYLLHKIYLPNSFIVKNPKLIFLHRVYLFFKIIKHRRKFLDKFTLSFLTLLSKLKLIVRSRIIIKE